MTYKERKFQALMVDDFKTKYIEWMARSENRNMAEVEKAYGGDDLNKLHDRISGKEVVIIECEYLIGETDHFEEVDNNIWIGRELFTELKAEEVSDE